MQLIQFIITLFCWLDFSEEKWNDEEEVFSEKEILFMPEAEEILKI